MIDLYSRQEQIGLYCPKSVTIAGIGGIGSWVAIYAAMSGVPTLYLFDEDNLEESNRNRLPFCQGSIGRPKVEVVAEYINAIRPEAIVAPIKQKLDGIFLEIQLSVSEVIMDCTDSPKSQIRLYSECKKNSRRFIRAGYDGTHIMVTSNVSGWIKNVEEREAYTIAPSWVVPASVVAALAVGKLMKYNGQE
jgi:tRNA A37 threonylcarbamoyladenosine dehydratase